MPTPSSNQPPDPFSPIPFPFPTCPDDVQYTPRLPPHQIDLVASTQPHGIEVQSDTLLDGSSPPAFESRPSRPGEPELVALNHPSSTVTFPRAATLTPDTHFTDTPVTSPAPNGPDSNVAKGREAGLDGLVNHASSAALRRCPGRASLIRDMESQDSFSLDGWDDLLHPTPMGMDFSSKRTIPVSPSSYLRPGSRFHGTQQSERQVYDVQVEIKHVDMRESFLCGYLRIQGLTEDHPTLTTYFEGEIIGSKYGFITEHDDWGASLKTDMNHWGKFNAFRPFQKLVRKGTCIIGDIAQRDNIFMRWKEHFLVPDHRVRTITGASFEGFYYICFNQLEGDVSGIYFHSKSEKFQQLELKHVPNRGCFSATEFR
ncbi:vesicle-mediated transporter Vid24 [Ophiocordyceps camponoti-floridani]|uniref:Vesicle-mediated transporter Vid24 n=1 Tax=Ophiocordyceps camponoti-floridani TaxID=2030778 RepID=A0A8H4VCA9_9HYPO|nr:vesicle-mediated transporter Vid24 [Ophiocordyceps camponoti-floridani]